MYEFLSLPTIYCGETRVDNHLILYCDMQSLLDLNLVGMYFENHTQPSLQATPITTVTLIVRSVSLPVFSSFSHSHSKTGQ